MMLHAPCIVSREYRKPSSYAWYVIASEGILVSREKLLFELLLEQSGLKGTTSCQYVSSND